MDIVMVAWLVCTAVCVLCVSHLVLRFLERRGEDRFGVEKEGRGEGGGGVVVVGGGGGGMRKRRGVSGKRVRFDGVDDERLVEERCGSEMKAVVSVVVGFENAVEIVGGVEGVESVAVESGVRGKSVELDCGGGESAVEKKLEVEERPTFEDMSGLTEVEEICETSVSVGDGGVEFGIDNDVCSGRSEVVCSVDSGCVGGDTQDMDVEDVCGGGEEVNKEFHDELADRIEECIRKTGSGVIEKEGSVNEGCKNVFEETAEPKDVADRIGGESEKEGCLNEGCKNEVEETAEPKDVADRIGGETEKEDCVNEGCKNEFEETAEPKDVADQIGGKIEEEDCVDEGRKNVFDETEASKDRNFEIKDKVVEERFESSEEDDDWEGIEMSELYNDFSAAAAFVRREENDGKLSYIGNEVKMQLYGLQKIAMEGPCHEAQPMALKMSARAKWNAWQRLGNMNPEDAMKQYIALVSGLNPEWREQTAMVDDQSENVGAIKLSISDPGQSKTPNESQKKNELTNNAEGMESIHSERSSL